MSKKIFLILLVFLALPAVSAAANGQGVTIQGMVAAAVKTALYIASGVVVILWLITGLLFLTASGAPEKLGKARNALLTAVAGTIIIIVAQSAIYLVGQAFGINI